MRRNLLTTTLIAAGLSMTVSQVSIATENNAAQPDSSADVAQQQALLNVQLNRASVIVGIIDRLRPEAQAQKLDESWEDELGDALGAAEAEQLISAQQASGYDAVVRAITNTGSWPELDPLSRGGGITRALGSTGSDLVFTPVPPCRIVDTRLTGAGRIPGGGSRSFRVHGNLASQGGSVCNNPSFDPGGVAINVTSTAQVSHGFLTVYPDGTSLPLASTVNYLPGQNVANSTVVQSRISAGNDIRVHAHSSSHVVIDLVGYFAAPVRTAPNVVHVRTDRNVSASSNQSFQSPSCPSGYTFSGAGHNWGGSSTDVWFWQVSKDGAGNRARCRVRNSSAVTITATCEATCIRIPGR